MTTLVSWIQLIIIPGGQVTARGCSTMQPTFNKCETHKYGQFKSDKYCYCKETFCNHSSSVMPNIYCLGEQPQQRLVLIWNQSPGEGISLRGKRGIIAHLDLAKELYLSHFTNSQISFFAIVIIVRQNLQETLLLNCSCSSGLLSVPRHQQLS